jgi:hypothetical protein
MARSAGAARPMSGPSRNGPPMSEIRGDGADAGEPEDGEGPGHDEARPAARPDGNPGPPKTPDQPPPGQEARAAQWGERTEDDGGTNHEATPPAPHVAGSGQETTDGRRDYPGAVPRGGYRGYVDPATSARIALEDQLPSRQEHRAAVTGGDEKDPAGHDGAGGARTGERHQAPGAGQGRALDSGPDEPDQDASGEVAPTAGMPGDRPAAVPSAGAAAEREDGSAEAPGASPAGATADAGSTGEPDAGKRSVESPQTRQADSAGQTARPDDAPVGQDTAPEAGLGELLAKVDAKLEQQDAKIREQDAKLEQQRAEHNADLKELKAAYEARLEEQGAKYEARLEQQEARHQADVKSLTAENEAIKEKSAGQEVSLKKLKAELQALNDGRQTAPDAPDGAEGQAGQSRPEGNALPESQQNPEETKHQDDKPGLLSNAKYQLYGVAGSTMMSAFISEAILDSPVSAITAIVSAVPSAIAAFVPVVREGWRRKRDRPSAKP